MKLSKKLIISIGIIGFILLTGIVGFYSLNTDLTSENTEMNVVAAGSMEPTLHRGDIIIVENNPSNLYVGDIVVYNATWFKQPVIHRIIAIKKYSNGETVYELKGDNNPVSDLNLVKRNQIISKVKMEKNSPAVIPKLGYITLWIKGI